MTLYVRPYMKGVDYPRCLVHHTLSTRVTRAENVKKLPKVYTLRINLTISVIIHVAQKEKSSWASTNPRLFVAFIKGTRPMVSAVKIKFLSLVSS